MRQALIHIGLPKAGSTSVQATLSGNRDVLAAAGIGYGRFMHLGQPMIAHTAAFIQTFASDPERFVANKREMPNFEKARARFSAEFEANLADDQPLIFSSEIISGFLPQDLVKIRDYFIAGGYAPRFVVIVRSPLALLSSLVQQAMRAGGSSFLPVRALDKDLRLLVKKIRDALPEAEFYPFSQCVAHAAGPGGFVADLVSPGLSDRLTEQRANTSFSDNAAELICHLNKVVPFWIHAGRKYLSPLRSLRDTAPLEALSGDRFYVRKKWMGEFHDQVVAENDWLRRTLGPEFCDPTLDIDNRPIDWRPDHARELAAILPAYPRHIQLALADFFTLRSDVPDELKALAASYAPRPPLSARLAARTRAIFKRLRRSG